MNVTVGITAHPDPARFRDALDALSNHAAFHGPQGPVRANLLVLVDPSLIPGAALPNPGQPLPLRLVPPPGGGAARFNQLASYDHADVVVLLEAGAIVQPGWLDALLGALHAQPTHGLAGPSTNWAWNQQRALPPSTANARLRPSGAPLHWQTLLPLHSLNDFCYAVRREVILAIGSADESYGQGPCWEMDYNIRAARAGWLGVWTRTAFVRRLSPLPAQRHAETLAFTASKHRYQDKFCGARLRAETTDYRTHCRGDACPNFAPTDRITLRLPFPAHEPPLQRPPAQPPAPANRPSLARWTGEGRGEGPTHPFKAPLPVHLSENVPTLEPSVHRAHPPNPRLPRIAPPSPVPRGEGRGEGSSHPFPPPAPPRIRVSCIMPTFNRVRFVRFAIERFLQQTVTDAELVIVDDGTDPVRAILPDHPRLRLIELPNRLNTGAKRNVACTHAQGEIIVHWDDDDWYPVDRLERQVAPFGNPQTQISGTSTLYYHDSQAARTWRYAYAGNAHHWVAGNTLAYRRSWWQSNPFPEVQVGEDNRFVWTTPARAVTDLRDPSLCVARIHPDNTSPKHPQGLAWNPEPTDTTRRLLGSDWDAFAHPATPVASPACPLVSCIMPTRNRRAFVELALRAFALQDYPNRELIIVDDGDQNLANLVVGLPGVRHLRFTTRMSIGRKRQIACEAAQGEFIAHWDDDDWYAPGRLSHQLAPLLAGAADLTGLENAYSLDLASGGCWRITPALHARMFVGDVHGGTIVYRRSILQAGIHYPDRNLAEDAALIQQALRARHRLLKLPNPGLFVYVRHGSNAWRFHAGTFLDPGAWNPTPVPPAFQSWLPAYQHCVPASVP